jgi:hypothetical protein
MSKDPKDKTTDEDKKVMRLQLFSRMMEYEKSIEDLDYISNVVDHFMDPHSNHAPHHDPLAVIPDVTPLEANDLLSPLDSPLDKD